MGELEAVVATTMVSWAPVLAGSSLRMLRISTEDSDTSLRRMRVAAAGLLRVMVVTTVTRATHTIAVDLLHLDMGQGRTVAILHRLAAEVLLDSEGGGIRAILGILEM